MNRRILITGVSGYLGQSVKSIIPNSIGLKSSECNLDDQDQVKKYIHHDDIIIHCAAKVPKTSAEYNDQKLASQNLMMVKSIVNAQPFNIIFASSMTVYDGKLKRPVKEHEVGTIICAYAQSKLAAEKKLADSGIQYTALRLPGLFGAPRTGGLIDNIASAFVSKTQPKLVKKAPLWAAFHVDDAAEIIKKIALAETGYGPINIGYNEQFSVSDTIYRLAQIAGCPIPDNLPIGPKFSMNLTKLKSSLGLSKKTFHDRLVQVVKSYH
jgi:nucleoside-diphosphate-sugar epimerase